MDHPKISTTLDLFGPQLPEFAELPDPVKSQLTELVSKLLVDHHQSQIRRRKSTDVEQD